MEISPLAKVNIAKQAAELETKGVFVDTWLLEVDNDSKLGQPVSL